MVVVLTQNLIILISFKEFLTKFIKPITQTQGDINMLMSM